MPSIINFSISGVILVLDPTQLFPTVEVNILELNSHVELCLPRRLGRKDKMPWILFE